MILSNNKYLLWFNNNKIYYDLDQLFEQVYQDFYHI